MQGHNKNIFIYLTAVFCLFFSFSCCAQPDVVNQSKKNIKEVNDKNKSINAGDPWTINNVIMVDELESLLKKQGAKEAYIYQVGFFSLYSQGHIKGALYAGPASKEEGLQKLQSSIKDLPRDKEIILYCGCCNWVDCPNIRPAFETVNNMGFKNVRVLYLPDNLTVDWVNKGLPVDK
jgi:thiosulfate/3-mercaptopyruvate sulfurtransferase